MEHELNNISFLQPSAKPVHKNTGRRCYKRKHVKNGKRTMVGTRLTAEQMAKLDNLVSHYSEVSGVQATAASVLAELVDRAGYPVVTGELS